MKKKLLILLGVSILTFSIDLNAQIRITGVDPNQNLIFIRNFGASPVDVTNYMLCSKFNYFTVGSLNVIAGNPSALGSMQTAWVQGNSLDATGADLGLFLPGTSGAGFGQASNMLDFVQWKTGGNGRESVAVAKGIWTAGAFVCGDPTYTFTGNGTTDFGDSFWTGVNCTVSVIENSLENKISIYPNPVTSVLNINVSPSISLVSYKLTNLLGQVIIESAGNINAGNLSIDVSALTKGNYTLVLNTSEGLVNKKVVITQ